MQGTMTAADTTVTFIINDNDPKQSAIFVQDGLSGKQHFAMNLEAFDVRAALIVMLDGDEHELGDDIMEAAERVQPSDPELRFIP